jgi:hypothetical protein
MKIRNNVAAFGGVFSLCFLCACSAFTYILIRDGLAHIQIFPPDFQDYYPAWFIPLVLVIFWLAGLGLANYLAKIPCVHLEVLPDRSVSIVKRYPFRKEANIFKAAELSPAEVVEATDSDGDPYFYLQLRASNGITLNVVEGHDRKSCEEVGSRFNAAIGKE